MTDARPTPIAVLVIEDDRIIRTMLGDLLAACGYQVTLAENGVEGLSRLRMATTLIDRLAPLGAAA